MKYSCNGRAGPQEEMRGKCLKNYKMPNKQEASRKLPLPSLQANGGPPDGVAGQAGPSAAAVSTTNL